MENNIEIIRSRRKSLALEIKPDGRIIARAPLFVSEREIRKFVESKSAWIDKNLRKLENEDVERLSDNELTELYERAREYIPRRAEHYAEILGVKYNKITVRCQKTKWGSCSAKGNLNFNCLLMLTPDEVIDSVVVHELCHLREMNHSKCFYDLVLSVYPDYKKHNKWLKDNGAAIMKRAAK